MRLFVRGVEKRKGGRKNKDVDHRQQAQQQDDFILKPCRDSGGRVGTGVAQNILNQLKTPSSKHKFGFEQIYMWNRLYLLKKTGQSVAISETSINQTKPANVSHRGQSFFVKLNAWSSP